LHKTILKQNPFNPCPFCINPFQAKPIWPMSILLNAFEAKPHLNLNPFQFCIIKFVLPIGMELFWSQSEDPTSLISSKSVGKVYTHIHSKLLCQILEL
jgi:hypothetical protein